MHFLDLLMKFTKQLSEQTERWEMGDEINVNIAIDINAIANIAKFKLIFPYSKNRERSLILFGL